MISLSPVALTLNGRSARPAPSPRSHEELVRVEALNYAYGRGPLIVDDVNLVLHRGQVHCLLGASGSGKTTLLRLIAGLERAQAGRITIGGQLASGDGQHVPPERRPVGFVFQDYALFPHLTVRRNVMFGMADRPRRRRAAAADELLERVGMSGFEKAMPHTLSGGQQQRVALARALGRNPMVMLLDEPFSGLDVELRDRVRDMTLQVLREAGVATLMVTHDPREALVAADTVSVMRNGRIAVQGKPCDVCVCRPDAHGGTTVRLCTEVETGNCDQT